MKKNKKLRPRKYYEIGTPLFEAWYANKQNVCSITVDRYKNFKRWQENRQCFSYNGKVYTEDGIDHFNGHISNYEDRGALYGVYLREVVDY